MRIHDTIPEDNQYYMQIGSFWAWGSTKAIALSRLAHNIYSHKFSKEK